MAYFGRFYLDQEKDIIVNLYMEKDELSYVLETPNHKTGNLIANLAQICHLPVSFNSQGLKVIKGKVPCYINAEGREVYVFRLNNTKTANIYPDGRIEMKASVPAIAKTLMSQTKNYHLPFDKTVVKAYIRKECKFSTDLHTHMNANLSPDLLIALGIYHQIEYPYYYIRKLKLKLTEKQKARLKEERETVSRQYENSTLAGKYLTRKIDDHTMINFASFILEDPDNAAYNIPRIRASLAVMKDGQAVFTNLEKVYLYRYVFTKGKESEHKIPLEGLDRIPDPDIVRALKQMEKDRENPAYRNNTLFQDKLLWIARSYASRCIRYAEISDTSLVKKEGAIDMLEQVHAVMPAVYAETSVRIRFLAAMRRIPLTIVKDQISMPSYGENLQVLEAVIHDPYVAGSDIVGEEINDIRELAPLIHELVRIAAGDPSFTIRIHAGENDSLRDNVYYSIRCVEEALAPGQPMPKIRIGHGLYTASLSSRKGRQLLDLIQKTGTVLEFQITSNVRLNNLGELRRHPLKQYLQAGVRCVQGTDGGALYGTDSIDEQLALERMLDLSFEDMCRMHKAEEEVRLSGEDGFRQKEIRQNKRLRTHTLRELYEEDLKQASIPETTFISDGRENARDLLGDLEAPFPAAKIPVIAAGGSFNNDSHVTRMNASCRHIIDSLVEQEDPRQIFFVVGHTLSGYEKYLVQKAAGRFTIYAIVPARIRKEEAKRIRAAGLKVRISIEPAQMGLYKSFTYEIFKKRPSVLLALDGNSAAANLIQDGRNSRWRTYAFLNTHCHTMKIKADWLEGYITMLEDDGDIREIDRRIHQAYAEEITRELKKR